MKRNRFIALEIGAERVRLTEYANGEVVASGETGFDSESTGRTPREALVATTLKRLLNDLKPVARSAIVAVEGASVFARLVRLPPRGPDKLWRALEHEAELNVPFPIQDVVWDARVFDAESSEPDALLVAVKDEFVRGMIHAVAANGLSVERVVPAPVARAVALVGTMERAMVVEVKADAAELVFVDPPRFFFRSLAIPGMTEARLELEIERSLSLFDGERKGAPVQRRSPSDPAWSVAAGLALDELLDIDLTPADLRRARSLRKRWPLWVACGVAVVALLGVWIGELHRLAARADARRERLGAGVAELKAVEARLIPVERRIAQLERAAAAYQNAMNQRVFLRDALMEISRRLPEGMFLLSSETLVTEGEASGLRIEIVSYLDREPDGIDAVKATRDALRSSEWFSEETRVQRRPSRGECARRFTLDVHFEEARS